MAPPNTVFDSALHWLKLGRFDQALPLFLNALSKYESMPQTAQTSHDVCRCRYFAAKAAAQLGLNSKAEALFKAAVQAAPSVLDTTTRAAAYLSYGEFLVEHGRNAEAIPHLQAGVALNDYPANGWRLLGIAFDEVGQHEEAYRSFQRALDADPLNPDILYNLGVCFGYLKRFDESYEAFDQAINLSPAEAHAFRAQAYNARGGMLKSAGRYESAEADFRMAIQLDPKHDGAPFNLADLLERLGRGKEALLYWQKAVELDPSDQSAPRRLARLRMTLGEK